jgi:tetratricopeptide (TPR) repeat protein
MDCRKFLVVALASLIGAAGCAHLGTNDQPQVTSTFTLSSGDDKPPPPDAPKRDPLPGTCVAGGDYLAAEAKGKADIPIEQQQLQDKARKAYQQALRIDPKYVPAYQALANLYLDMHDYDHAIATLEKGVQVAPNDALLHFDLGMTHCRKKEFTAGLPDLKKAMELDPENRLYVDTLGYTLARAGQQDEALAVFTRVHGKAMAHYMLARMLEHMQDRDQCQRHLQLALADDPQLEVAQAMLMRLAGGTSGEVQPVGYIEPASN